MNQLLFSSEKENEDFTISLERPDYIDLNSDRGNENVTTDDKSVPLMKQCQSLSEAKKKSDPGYVEGLQDGDFYIPVTRKNYGQSINVVFVGFKHAYSLKKTAKGKSGFVGSFSTLELADNARNAIAHEEGVPVHSFVIEKTHQHLLLVLDGNTSSLVIFDMASSKLKVSKNINAMISQYGGDRFSRVYSLTSVEASSPKGSYYTIKVDMKGYTPKPIYEEAAKAYTTKDALSSRAEMEETLEF